MTDHKEKKGKVKIQESKLQKLEWALEWLDKHGLQALTQATVTENGWNIGWWIDYQRRLAPEEDIVHETLDARYPEWRKPPVSTPGPRAKNRPQQLVDYVKRNGGALPPVRAKDDDGFAVGSYLHMMRFRYEKEPESIRAETIDLFNREIPGWTEPRRKDRIQQLIAWVERNGGKLPAPGQKDSDGYAIGSRLTSLQKQGREGLRQTTIDALDEGIPNWESKGDRLTTTI